MNNFDIYHKWDRIEVANFVPKKYFNVLEIGCAEGGFRKNLLNENEYWRYKDLGILDRRHLSFFSENSIKRDFEHFNFLIEESKGINRFIFGKTMSSLKMAILIVLFGKDTKYQQLGFRVKLK